MNTDDTDRARQWRMFCAFELPEALRARISEHSRKVREAVPEAAASWSRPENIHLTMKFFGNVEQEKVSVISAAAEPVMKEFSPVRIEVGTTGVFPRASRPQVLWIGIEDASGALAKLHLQLEDAFAREGFSKEDRAFRPHLTIARIRKPQNAARLAQTHLEMNFTTVDVTLSELILFRSELSPKGSRYTPLSRHRLED
jgi:RNA 2',3'-cyclic 3'-phosphodiesterase